MDRPAQEPPEPATAADSPLSFPVEAPKLAGIEPGAGAPAHSPVEATAPRQPGPLVFPAEAAPTLPVAGSPLFPPEPAAAPPLAGSPLFPAEPATAVPPPAQPLPFPVAELPATAAVPGSVPAVQPQPQPQAQPEYEPEPAPVRTPAAAGLLRLGPALLAGAAALLAAAGCFLPLFALFQQLDLRQGLDHARLTITETAWGTRIEIPGQEVTDRPGAPVGIPVIIAVAVLAVAAFTAFSRPGRGLTRWLLSAGAVFTAGVVSTIGMSRFELAAIAGEEADLEVATEPGMWLLLLAAALAAVAAVLAHLPLRKPGWADPAVAYADTPTPPSGIAITVLPPDDEHA